jgi:hypothetical protein
MNHRFILLIILFFHPAVIVSQYFPDPAWDMPLPIIYGGEAPATLGDPDHFMRDNTCKEIIRQFR